MLLSIVLFILFKIILDYTFVHSVSPLYAYAGLVTDMNPSKIILSYMALLLLAMFLPTGNRRPSDFALVILFVFIVIPILSLWGLQNEASGFVAMVLTSFAMLEILMKVRFSRVRIPDFENGRRYYSIIAWTLVGVLFAALISRGGLRYLNLNFLKVYDLRAVVTEALLEGGWAYLWIWCGKSFLVVLMGMALWKRQWSIFAAIFGLEILLFALTTHKELLFYPLIVTFVYLCVTKGYRLSRVFVLGLCGILVMAVIMDTVTGNHLFLGVLVYRAFDTIGLNHFAYYHFFQNNPYVIFSNGILSSVFKYPYSEQVPLLIGAGRYGAGSEPFVNAGYIASGYMQLGVAGVFVYTILIAIIMKLFDTFTVGRMPVWLGTVVMAVSIFQLVNTDLTTAIMTHGIAINLLALWMIGSRNLEPATGIQPATAAT
jgi:hypothetical protein